MTKEQPDENIDYKSIIEAKNEQIDEYRDLIRTFKAYDSRRKRHYKEVLKENERLSALVAELKQALLKYQS